MTLRTHTQRQTPPHIRKIDISLPVPRYIPTIPTRNPTRINLLTRQPQGHIAHQKTARYAFAARAIVNLQSPISNLIAINIPFASGVIDPTIGQLCESGTLLKVNEKMEWQHSTANEIRFLAQG